MARTALDYKRLLMHLLPRGRLWTRDPDSYLAQMMYAFGEELARVESRIMDLFTERDSRKVTEMVSEMEEELGLPDATHPLRSTLAERRLDLNAKLLSLGGQHEQYFVSIATAMGYTIEIGEFFPAICGVMKAGDSCGGGYNIFYWKVSVSANGNKKAFDWAFHQDEYDTLPGNSYDYIYSMVRDFSLLMVELNRIKPAHTYILFDWWQRAYDRSFGWAFDAFPTNDGEVIPTGYNYEFDSSFGNTIDYGGEYLIGSFNTAFDLAYDGKIGNEFDFVEYSSDFSRSL